jgi:hypothetical protein
VWYASGMTSKATKPRPPRAAVPAVEVDERYQAEVDGFVSRNRDELNASIRRSREEVGNGVQAARTIDEIIADGLRRHSAS